jgi:ectoine hydroxylase-related dioxygenase (phytanoyl-CoA dioxygenase family)
MAFSQLGFEIHRQVFPQDSLDRLESVLREFHSRWCRANKAFYESRAVNSAYLTDQNILSNEKRLVLFEFLAGQKLLNIVEQYIKEPAFLNTQLFFDPFNPEQKNYWHRDIQYGNTLNQQLQMLQDPAPMPHFRIPLVSETGLELVPGTHTRWDTEDELNVRLEQNGKHSWNNLEQGQRITLERGDVLVFCAKMLHRGLYGDNRFAFDVLYAPAGHSLLSTVSENCLPDSSMPDAIKQAPVFARTRAAQAN